MPKIFWEEKWTEPELSLRENPDLELSSSMGKLLFDVDVLSAGDGPETQSLADQRDNEWLQSWATSVDSIALASQ